MRYIWLVIFNIIALLLLFVFLFGENGVLDSIKKIDYIYNLKKEKYLNEIELENLKYRYEHLKSLSIPDQEIYIRSGYKLNNSIIFKFFESIEDNDIINSKFDKEKILKRLYFTVFLYILILLSGNFMLMIYLK